MFDKDLFLSLCKKYGVKMSSEYGQPMIEDAAGNIAPLTDMEIHRMFPFLFKRGIQIPAEASDYADNEISAMAC